MNVFLLNGKRASEGCHEAIWEILRRYRITKPGHYMIDGYDFDIQDDDTIILRN
jgi:hypothetical protein